MFSWLENLFKPDNSSETLEDLPVWLFVGLGNPGAEYAHHRHNIGFMVIELIADHAGFPPFQKKFHGLKSEHTIDGQKAMILMPQTFMNESGQSVAEACKFYKIPPERVIVFHDELDLSPGEVRLKQGGGNAGHNGLKSIQAHLGTPDFWRVRIGIGHPGAKHLVSNYVLSNFAKSEEEWALNVIEVLSENFALIMNDGPKAYEKKIRECL